MCISRDDFPDTNPPTPIEVDSELGLKLGLSSDIFVARGNIGTQLFRVGDDMYIQLIEVKTGGGHLDRLLGRLWYLGFTIKVPNTTHKMERTLEHRGFTKIEEPSHLEIGKTEIVMVKEPQVAIQQEKTDHRLPE
jgi:hypothetical protein